ncbi:putative quinol monooxygenase [Chitinophaga nivalis]|uniref:Uncharacterized protein n=1 Tax=Chitinophaga nivalis TaxID=2991709 RepID=A0ABT3ITV1_9BACT|nr:hypothetical protein [Chitinophaga nivalis]MCW3462984.1 hypothetical protein [Chitinophaga nivalis]MCW3487326.1 hypothetical protein [Chitinophaga nivalis]
MDSHQTRKRCLKRNFEAACPNNNGRLFVPVIHIWYKSIATCSFMHKNYPMVNGGLLIRLHAKPGKEAELAEFLKSGHAIVVNEPATISWYAIQLAPAIFGIFNTFPDDAGIIPLLPDGNSGFPLC